MAREIPLGQIGDYYEESVRKLVEATTLEAEGRLKDATPVDTGRLRNSWVADPKKGEITNNVVYAEPVVYGTSLPPSWGGKYRTQQNTTPGYPDLIAKELESWAKKTFQNILRR
jgi:hypothetical protein